ncbi:unnamed protein product, partial [Symbiodinium microadriaticum]
VLQSSASHSLRRWFRGGRPFRPLRSGYPRGCSRGGLFARPTAVDRPQAFAAPLAGWWLALQGCARLPAQGPLRAGSQTRRGASAGCQADAAPDLQAQRGGDGFVLSCRRSSMASKGETARPSQDQKGVTLEAVGVRPAEARNGRAQKGQGPFAIRSREPSPAGHRADHARLRTQRPGRPLHTATNLRRGGGGCSSSASSR